MNLKSLVSVSAFLAITIGVISSVRDTSKERLHDASRSLRNNTPDYNISNGIVNVEFKTIFFPIAKVGSSQWDHFFARLEGNSDWCSVQIHKPEVNKFTYLRDYSLKEVDSMMKSKEWTKATFVRDPKERLLSAFLDKSITKAKKFRKTHCVAKDYLHNGGNTKECIEKHTDFEYFVKEYVPRQPDNNHWRPQCTFIDDQWWPYIDFIGDMRTASNDAKDYLQSIHNKDGVSAWEKLGKTGWTGENDCTTNGDLPFFGQATRKESHTMHAESKLKMYYTPELELFVEKYYEKDYHNDFFEFQPLEIFPHGRSDDDDYYETDGER